MRIKLMAMVFTGLTMAACGQPSDSSTANVVAGQENAATSSYLVLGDDLRQLKEDFNANEGRVRLLFLSGPTCGICLRGMADLNDEFIAASQNDDRLVTFVVHVPALGAREEHVASTIPLLDGPRVHHYWDPSGVIGSHFTDVMDVNMYVWDFWTIYGTQARWEGTLPPKPNYFEHQLGGFPRAKMLNAERFGVEAAKFIDRVDTRRFARSADVTLSASELFADGTTIPVVAQPRNAAVRQHIMGRGGFKNLKRIHKIEMHGYLQFDGESYPLEISLRRPNLLQRKITVGDQQSISEVLEDGQVVLNKGARRGLPVATCRI